MKKTNTTFRRQKAKNGTPPIQVVNPSAAGMDIGSEEHFVAVPEDRDPQPIQRFKCYTSDLLRMAEWLKSCGVTTVAMESTGVYWIPAFEVLEQAGFQVLLVDARHVKNVSGRKSDVSDARWIQQLHSFGLLSGAFRPTGEIARLRAYWRQRGGLVEACSRQIHLMQKALEQMNVQLHKAVSDITGVTGMSIIRKIIEGQRDPHALAELRQRGVKRTEAEIAEALNGNYRPEHVFALQQALSAFDFFQGQIQECDRETQAYMATLALDKPAPETTSRSRRRYRRKNQAYFDLGAELHRIVGVDLTQIEGLDALTTQTVITECGLDMSPFPTEKNFVSWLGLCPNNRKTGGVIRSRRTRKVASRAATALRVAAQSLSNSKSALGAFLRRLKIRIGAAKAITATAHKLARIIYRLLKYGEAYVALGEERYKAQQHERSLKSLRRHAKSMGYALVDTTTGVLIEGGVS
jgi:transposase